MLKNVQRGLLWEYEQNWIQAHPSNSGNVDQKNMHCAKTILCGDNISSIRVRLRLHCKYLQPNYDQIAANGRITTAIPWFQPLVVGCQSIFIVDIGIKV